MIDSLLRWLFKPSKCKLGYHNMVSETVIKRNDKNPADLSTLVIYRLQCTDCPHHSNGWEFNPRQNSLRSFR